MAHPGRSGSQRNVGRQVRILKPCSAVLALTACGLAPGPIDLDDQRVQPLLEAMRVVDREGLDFTALPHDAEFRLEGRAVNRLQALLIGKMQNYDAMLHVCGKTSRTIVFARRVKGSSGSENRRPTPAPGDSIRPTECSQRVKISGAPLEQVYISYSGENPELAWPRELTLADIEPYLKKWGSSGEPRSCGGR